MITRRFGIALLLSLIAGPVLAQEPARCKLVRIAEWPVRLESGQPVMEGFINGKKVGVMLDTGAQVSLIMKASVERLDLVTKPTSETMVGFGGTSRVFVAWIEELRIGEAVRKSMRVRVAGEAPFRGVDFILGDDFFKLVDLEFDYAKGVVRVYQPENCKSSFLGYWDPNAQVLPIRNESKVVVPIKVNGREARAMIDSGASSSVMSLAFSEDVGVRRDSPGVMTASCTSGLGGGGQRSWVARFDSVALGNELIRDPQLRIQDYTMEMSGARDLPPDMFLGTDFLRSHRVFISRSQDKVYFSHNGGQVFPAVPAVDCDAWRAGKSPAEALVSYDEAIAANPKDTKALLQRAELRRRTQNPKGALADLDAVMQLEPKNAVARNLRSEIRAFQGDPEGALADSEVAIANGMRNAQMFASRGWIRQSQGDCEGAIAEYGEGLKLDPLHVAALRGRATCLLLTGRYGAAEADLVGALAVRPNGYDSAWLALARQRGGKEAKAGLEEGIAKSKDGEWPAPVLQFMLGRLDRDALLAAAGTDATRRKRRECDARFYMAGQLAATGKAAEARPLFEAARDGCPRNTLEYATSVAELAKP